VSVLVPQLQLAGSLLVRPRLGRVSAVTP
jgi:hypothetical protein